ncbi:MAG: ABC transporter permease [Chloroflexota bacterium]
MATMQQTVTSSVIKLEPSKKSESLWLESWRRLRRNKAALIGLFIILLNIFVALFAANLAPQAYDRGSLKDNNSAPRWVTQIFPSMKPKDDGGYVKVNNDYLFGTDALGRDMWSRIIYGTRVSLGVAFIGPFVSIVVGLIVGLIAGYFGGSWDNVLMRLVDIMYAFPTLLLIILMMTFFRTGFANPVPGSLAFFIGQLDQATGGMILIFVGIGLTSWMQMARLVRGQVLSQREREYVEAARALGDTTTSIMFRQILPNILGPLIIAETLTIPTYISYEAFLSFIGLGVNAPYPSWGSMISEGSRTISTYPYQALFPALALFLIMFAFNFLGDGLRDALDPRMRGQS